MTTAETMLEGMIVGRQPVMQGAVIVRPTVMLRVDEMRANDWNPNEESDEEFALLVETIREEGFNNPVKVCPVVPPDGKINWELIAGEHRWGAARVLGMLEIPAIVLDDYDTDRRKLATVRDNVLGGKLNPVKFTRLFNAMMGKYRDKQILAKMMGFATEETFKRVYRDVKRALPEEFAKKLAESGDEIQTIQDLSLALNRMFSEYGGTLPANYMIFSYGGREHLMVRCSARLWSLVKSMAEDAVGAGEDVNVRFAEVLLRGMEQSDGQVVGLSDGRDGVIEGKSDGEDEQGVRIEFVAPRVDEVVLGA